MRDPDLVQRAERAAMALERAWGHWRVMHGLGTDPPPPVSSYVGYSLEEPWGQPRVVFGVGAEEAEQLAALLAGHDCYGPVHAEVAARPDWRLAASSGRATAQGRPFDGGVSVPVQAPPPGAEPSAERDGWQVTATGDAEEVDDEPAGIGWYQAEPTAMDIAMAGSYRPGEDEAEPPGSPVLATPAEPASALPAPAVPGPDTLDPLPADPHEPPWLSGGQDGDDRGQGQPASGMPYSDERGAAGRLGTIPPPAEFWQQGEPAGTVELSAVEQASVIAFRRRPEQPADQRQEEAPAAPPTSDSHDAVPSQGPGYCGPRYQGVPPQYQPGPGQPDPPALFGPRSEDATEPAGTDQPEVARSRAGQAEAAQSGAAQTEAAQPEAAESEAAQSEAAQSEAGQTAASRPASRPSPSRSSAGRPKTVQSQVAQSQVAQSDAAQSGVRQSRTGQSKTGQSKTGQSKTGQPRTLQSGGQAKARQPRAVQSKAGQSRQTSAASSPGHASGREAGKRPQG